ncbi:MAG: tetratricopeptide repeat protein, partial [Acidimicrobiia bacterium]|nr:tetratricopeptide repeat protein [Acidimicrobiia bacterium]
MSWCRWSRRALRSTPAGLRLPSTVPGTSTASRSPVSTAWRAWSATWRPTAAWSSRPTCRDGSSNGSRPRPRMPTVRIEHRWVLGFGIWALCLLAAGCASRLPTPPPTGTLKYPEFMFPAVPTALAGMPGADSVGLGWRFLQVDDLRNAERHFESGLMRIPMLYPAQTGLAYVALARRDADRAVTAFDAALNAEPRYVPALIGKGQALLALERDTDALAVFEAALAADGSKAIPEEIAADLRRRIEVLEFRGLQDIIEAARRAAAGGKLDEARLVYGRAIQASPDSAFLHRELGLVERKLGSSASALEHFRRATTLDPDDAAALVQIGELLEQQQDFSGAEAAYRKAAAVLPSEDLSRRIAALGERAREARLPAEFRAIGKAEEITRADLAALIGIRLEPVLRNAPSREVVMTDVRGHWAEGWITQAARAGVLEAFPNHTFQPR